MLPEDMLPPDERRTESAAENPSHELDMVPFFSETGAMAEMQSLAIQGILESNGIPFTVSGNSTLPVTEFGVSVPKSRLVEAQAALAEAQAAGPAAAEQAEREGEMLGILPE